MNKNIYSEALKFQEELIKLVENFNAIDENYYLRTRDYFIRIYPNRIPEFLKDCRTLKNFTNKLLSVASGSGSWQERRNFIYSEFRDFLNFLEFGEVPKNNDNITKNDGPVSNYGIQAGGDVLAGGDIIISDIKAIKEGKDKIFDHRSEIMKTIYWILGSVIVLAVVYIVYKTTGINLNIK